MKCIVCGNEVEKIAKALCQKLIGRKTKQILCLSCLANHLEAEEEDLLQKAQEFKDEGCALFK